MYDVRHRRYDALAGRFTGKERDTETGLDYFGATYVSGAKGIGGTRASTRLQGSGVLKTTT